MPTNKKRVGFIPREDVMKIIDKLSIENNLSNSKIISILVEEALSIRGIFNKKTGKVLTSYLYDKDNINELSEETAYSEDNKKFIINTKLGNNKNFSNSISIEKTNQETFNLQTYKNFLSFLKFQEMIEEYNE